MDTWTINFYNNNGNLSFSNTYSTREEALAFLEVCAENLSPWEKVELKRV